MPLVTLTSNGVAYNLYTLLAALAEGKGHPRNVTGLHILFPSAQRNIGAYDFAANASGVLGIGKANAGATALASLDLVMLPDESERWPGDGSNLNMVSLATIDLQASVNNALVLISYNVG